jgi:hypothetical protein
LAVRKQRKLDSPLVFWMTNRVDQRRQVRPPNDHVAKVVLGKNDKGPREIPRPNLHDRERATRQLARHEND